MRRHSSLLTAVLLAVIVSACDQRDNPRIAGIGSPTPTITAPTGTFVLREVQDSILPHVSLQAGTQYKLLSGTLDIHADSTWLYHSVTTQVGPNGIEIGPSPANYAGQWTATDSTLELAAYGSLRIRGDTIFWTGGPRFSWESPLKFTLTR